MGKFSISELIKLIFRFFAVALPMAMNMRRVLSSKSDSIDDMFFVLSIITGLLMGLYWDTFFEAIIGKFK